jgi:hypothetical protein
MRRYEEEPSGCYLDKAKGLRLHGFPKGNDEDVEGQGIRIWGGRETPYMIQIHNTWIQEANN